MLDNPERGHLKVTKVKIERGLVAVTPRPIVPIDNTMLAIGHLIIG